MIAPAGPRRGPAAPGVGLAGALELAALGIGLTFVVTLLAGLGSWLAHLGAFQGLLAVAFVFYGVALLRLRRFASLPRVAWWVFGVSLATRAALVPVVPSLSDDLYRYVWEGRVAAAGHDPYRLSPSDTSLAPLRDREVYPRINHKQLATIYPPAAIAGFAAVTSVWSSPIAMKLWIALHDLALVAVMLAWLSRRGESPAAAIAYAWNPLVLVEYAGSGHNDPTAIVWLALALLLAEARPRLSALCLSLGALVKLAPLVALPALLVRWPRGARWICLGMLAVGLGGYALATRSPGSGLDAYAATWRNNEFLFKALELGGNPWTARLLAAGIVVAMLAATALARWAPERAAQLGTRVAALVTPVLHPWYLGWVLVYEPFTRSAPWLLLSLMVALSYGVASTPAEGRDFHLPLAWRGVEYGIPAVLALGLATWRRRPRATQASS